MLARHYGMDWLRIGAFGLLILYHIGMFFVHWDWHVKTAEPLPWVAIPMLALSPWRLPLLFVVSGYATTALIARGGGLSFIKARTARLLIPVLVAAALVIPPQPWVELVGKHGYSTGLPDFWTGDYWSFRSLDGIVVPTWQHLWFVVYLWVYTLLVAAAAPLGRKWRLQSRFDRLFAGTRALLVPLAFFALARGLLVGGAEESHALFDDWPSHVVYLPGFLFGLGLARSQSAWAGIRQWWRWAGATAVLAYLPIVATELLYPGDMPFPDAYRTPYLVLRGVMGGAAIVALLGLADRFLNHDHPWRATLTEAVFPFYIVHQTVIVVLGWFLLRFDLPPGAEFVILLLATAAGCWFFYDLGRRVDGLRPLIGLKPRPSAAAPARA